jgi:CBS domain-containing protein
MKSIHHLVADREVLAVEAGQSVLDVARYMADRVIGAVPVLDGGKLVGIFTERDLMTRVVVPGLDASKTPVRDVMTKEIAVAAPDDRYSDCIARMKKVHCRHLPVVEEGRLLGTISLRDLLQEDIKERKAEIRLLTEYVQYVPPEAQH